MPYPVRDFVSLSTLVVGTLTNQSLSIALTDVIPRLMKFGFLVKTALPLNFIPQCKLTSTLETSADLQPTNLLKMGLTPLFSAKKSLMKVLSLSVFLIHWGVTFPIVLIISWFLFRLGESVVLWKIELGKLTWWPLQWCFCPVAWCCPCPSCLPP